MIAERVAAVRARIAGAAARARRDPAGITLVAVSKTNPPEAVREAFDAGLRVFGENRVQEAEGKAQALRDLGERGLSWHLVGHLQANKARKTGFFELIHSLDGAELGRKLARLGEEEGREVRVLAQVDLAGEETKFGIGEGGLFHVLESLRALRGLSVEGLMILPPLYEDPERTRPFFSRLRELGARAEREGLLRAGALSMGMSHDFEVAIEEGATHVRVGTAIFGERPPQA